MICIGIRSVVLRINEYDFILVLLRIKNESINTLSQCEICIHHRNIRARNMIILVMILLPQLYCTNTYSFEEQGIISYLSKLKNKNYVRHTSLSSSRFQACCSESLIFTIHFFSLFLPIHLILMRKLPSSYTTWTSYNMLIINKKLYFFINIMY